MTSSSLAKRLSPLFENKLGKDVHLKTVLSFSNFNILFGQFDCDVVLDYVVKIAVFKDGNQDEIELF
jgi:hypothetical protein